MANKNITDKINQFLNTHKMGKISDEPNANGSGRYKFFPKKEDSTTEVFKPKKKQQPTGAPVKEMKNTLKSKSKGRLVEISEANIEKLALDRVKTMLRNTSRLLNEDGTGYGSDDLENRRNEQYNSRGWEDKIGVNGLNDDTMTYHSWRGKPVGVTYKSPDGAWAARANGKIIGDGLRSEQEAIGVLKNYVGYNQTQNWTGQGKNKTTVQFSEWLNPINESHEEHSSNLADEIEDGDLVEFEGLGQRYVLRRIDNEFFWVTSNKRERNNSLASGRAVAVNDAIRIIEKADNPLSEWLNPINEKYEEFHPSIEWGDDDKFTATLNGKTYKGKHGGKSDVPTYEWEGEEPQGHHKHRLETYIHNSRPYKAGTVKYAQEKGKMLPGKEK